MPIIIVITGSQGHDNTFNHILLEAYSEGFRTVSIHPKDFYDSAKLKQIIETIKNKYSNSKIYGIGIEYGANLLVKYAATYP